MPLVNFNKKKEIADFVDTLAGYIGVNIYASETIRQDVTKLVDRAIKATENRIAEERWATAGLEVRRQDEGRSARRARRYRTGLKKP